MQAHDLHPIQEATDDEVETYYEVEEEMVNHGDLKMTKEQLEEEIELHYNFRLLKNHDHFHYFTFFTGSLAFLLCYLNYQELKELNVSSYMMIFGGTCLWAVTWLIYHPRFKHEDEVRKYYRDHFSHFRH